MKTSIRMWGNSLAARIARSIAAEARLELGSVVELEVTDGKLVITRCVARYSLDDMVSRINDENLPGCISRGQREGREAW